MKMKYNIISISLFYVIFIFFMFCINIKAQGIPKAKYVPNEIIVQFLPGTIDIPEGVDSIEVKNAKGKGEVIQLLQSVSSTKLKKVFKHFTIRDTIRTLEDGKKVRVQNLSQTFVTTFKNNIDVPAMVKKINASPNVLYAEPNYIRTEEDVPTDPYFPYQWGLKQSSNEDTDAPTAWGIQTGISNIKLGIFDTGIDYNHEDLGHGFGAYMKVRGGWDWVNNDADPMDDRFHGTLVAGIAGALTNNTNNGQPIGISGVAGGWNYERSTGSGNKGVQLFAMKVTNDSGKGKTSDFADAIMDASTPSAGGGYGINVLNLSFGGFDFSETERQAINYAARMGRVVVTSKGNNDVGTPHFPSDYDQAWIISVGATDELGRRVSKSLGYSWGSNYGNGIDVTAPGNHIYSTTPTFVTPPMAAWGLSQNYEYRSGTSMAAPYVSGLAALILSVNPDLHPEEVQGIICSSADDKGTPGYDDEYGAGRINAGRALQYMQMPWSLNKYTASGGSSVNNVTKKMIFYNTGGILASAEYNVKQYDVRKTVYFAKQYVQPPHVWGRGVNASTGWSGTTPNYETGYCNVVSSTSTSAQLQAYVYQVYDAVGTLIGWYPTTPANVVFAYSVHGITIDYSPQNLSISASYNHPYINWNASALPGLAHYEIWKKKNGTWSLKTTTTNTNYTDPDELVIAPSTTVYYKVCAVDGENQKTGFSNEVGIGVQGGIFKMNPNGADSVQSSNELPTSLQLMQNYPNPFNPSTTIKFSLPEADNVLLRVYNVTGQLVATLINGHYEAGNHKVDFNAQQLSSSVYFYKITTTKNTIVKRMLLLK